MAPGNWIQTGNHDVILRWQYDDSPYRIVCHKNDRGHWETLFTTTFENSHTKLIRGNLGGDSTGRMKAKTAALMFMRKHPYGCAPPNKIKDYKV